MNCEKGDLAMIVRGLAGTECRLVGTLVTVGTLHSTSSFFGPVWNVTHMNPYLGLRANGKSGKVSGVGTIGTTGHCPDDWLRPIRDPGEEAVDESLLWFRIPEFDTV